MYACEDRHSRFLQKGVLPETIVRAEPEPNNVEDESHEEALHPISTTILPWVSSLPQAPTETVLSSRSFPSISWKPEWTLRVWVWRQKPVHVVVSHIYNSCLHTNQWANTANMVRRAWTIPKTNSTLKISLRHISNREQTMALYQNKNKKNIKHWEISITKSMWNHERE